MKVAFYTLGCKLNQAETESLAHQFSEAGFQLTSPDDLADIYIINTCTVTHIADRKSRHWLRLIRRRNPQAFIIATGCYAQRAPQELAPIADLLLNNEKKERLLQTVTGFVDAGKTKQAHVSSISPNGISRVRSLIKVQDGCQSPCTFCIVPQVRPREYSLPASQIIREINEKVAIGYKEIVLTGTKVGCYKDAVLSTSEGSGAGLGDLVERILSHTGIERLRLSSLQPQEISPGLLALWQDAVPSPGEGPRLCRHFHLALQSGSDAVLHRMKRRYSLDDYQKAINLVRETIPGVAITTDIMVGFPGESDEEFEQSYSFCQQAGFANIHVFPFSPRPETQAARMPNQVKDQVKKMRTQRMLELSRSSWRSFCQRFLGQTFWVLWEKETSPESGVYSGLTDNYIRVFARSQKPLTNIILPVKLLGSHNQGMWGELADEDSS